MNPALLDDRFSRVRESVADACARAGRDPEGVRVVAITKGHPVETLLTALDAGLEDIGENRVQEARGKFAEAQSALTSRPVRRHLVGHLQRNKVRVALDLFDWIQSVDSVRLARAISSRVIEAKPVPVLIEVNVSREVQKHGFAPEEAVERTLEIAELPGLEVRGAMAMAPWTDEESVLRAAFVSGRTVFEDLRREMGAEARIDTLSMGMSNDYAVAVEEGATMVRLGTALFGPRGR